MHALTCVGMAPADYWRGTRYTQQAPMQKCCFLEKTQALSKPDSTGSLALSSTEKTQKHTTKLHIADPTLDPLTTPNATPSSIPAPQLRASNLGQKAYLF